ncbi:hypothetical protein [Crenothrix polyspora]|uniref:Uncharacterized protein n=1 Tax=Crenothrix polyspora TaxID=360316 RepID=A0A1R4H408_9GAMM|nr:hypothetical protein [Crenothrix polyspora]SJM90964.1 conserved hypothetical protein [Crenothrix polyspora]
MITALHSKRNRPYLHTLVFVLLVSWISFAISATCTMSMPSALSAMPEHMQGCSDLGTLEYSHHQDHAAKSVPDCTLKPCLESQTSSFPDFNRLANPELPVFILGLIWTFWCLFLTYPPLQVPRKTDPPLGRRVLLIYRFCRLLN